MAPRACIDRAEGPSKLVPSHEMYCWPLPKNVGGRASAFRIRRCICFYRYGCTHVTRGVFFCNFGFRIYTEFSVYGILVMCFLVYKDGLRIPLTLEIRRHLCGYIFRGLVVDFDIVFDYF